MKWELTKPVEEFEVDKTLWKPGSSGNSLTTSYYPAGTIDRANSLHITISKDRDRFKTSEVDFHVTYQRIGYKRFYTIKILDPKKSAKLTIVLDKSKKNEGPDDPKFHQLAMEIGEKLYTIQQVFDEENGREKRMMELKQGQEVGKNEYLAKKQSVKPIILKGDPEARDLHEGSKLNGLSYKITKAALPKDKITQRIKNKIDKYSPSANK